MGNVSKFERPNSHQLEWNTFHDLSTSQVVQKYVQGTLDTVLGVTPNSSTRVIVPIPEVVELVDAGDFGTLQPHPSQDIKNFYITSVHFPEYLASQGLSKKTALKTAAYTVSAYAAIRPWYLGLFTEEKDRITRLVAKTGGVQYPLNWGSEAVNGLFHFQQPDVVLLRSAACVALIAAGVEDFDPSSKRPYPAHIAALTDPLPANVVRVIHTVASHK